MQSQIYITDTQAANRYGVARGSIWRWLKENHDFPKPIRFSKGCVRWSISDLEKYEKKVAAANDPRS
jgi:prophage regulatory protein